MSNQKIKHPRASYRNYEPRQHLPRKYNIARVRKIYHDIYNCDVRKIDSYKSCRYQPYALYQLIDISTGNVLANEVTLHALGDALASENDY